MLFSPRAGLAFLHIHKTGGVSLRELLVQRVPAMAEMPELPQPHPHLFEFFAVLRQRGLDPLSVQVVTILRNPFAHAVSIYTFWNSDAISLPERELPTVAFARTHTFSEFLSTVLIRDQYAPALQIDGAVPENVHVLRLESLEADATRVLCDELGIVKRVRLKRRNASDHAPYRDFYDDASRAHVRRVYAWCFDAGYYADNDF